MKRICGECTLCCKLLPVVSLNKGANTKCVFQKFHKGCSVYHHPTKFPLECGMWSCMWLIDSNTAALSRPDRSHYVIDHFPDSIIIHDNESGEDKYMPAIQIWCDPNFPDAHRDSKLREYLEKRAKNEQVAAMVRYNSYDSIILFAPCLNTDNIWVEFSNKATNHNPFQVDIDNAIQKQYSERNPNAI